LLLGVNLFDKQLNDGLYNVLQSAFAAGVEQLVTLSVDAESSELSIELAKKYKDSVFALVGVHPSTHSESRYQFTANKTKQNKKQKQKKKKKKKKTKTQYIKS
jgi:Tat protein secretion system quality control protein TatD with DNase activity